MDANAAEFERLVVAMVTRYGAQVGGDVSAGTAARFAAQLRDVLESRGLPRPLAAGECGAPGGMTEADVAPLVAQVTAGIEAPWLAEAARQLVKACFYPEFTVCRDSYRELTREGACRRQELARVRSRISGAHCVDCPHWTALSPAEHGALLAGAWRGDPAEFAAQRSVFLPEDFRAFRVWRHAAARRAWRQS
ncbi:MAG: hypothetical protein JNL92_21030 [Opitutaceae bacterium]|nr:hypothetical protein [Opitutaceae bacterium]